MSAEQRIHVGALGRAHGVRGELRFYALNPGSDLLQAGLRVFVRADDTETALQIASVRAAAKFDIVRFVGIDDRDAAEALAALDLFVGPDALPPLEDGEFFLRDLVGLPVAVLRDEVGDECDEIGVVDGVFETGANDVIVVKLIDGNRWLVPLIDDAVAEVDLDQDLPRVLLWPIEQWAPEDTVMPELP